MNKIGKCILCEKEGVELRDSHIIPKFVYRRIKKYPNTRFRNYYNINKIYQDGEKKPLLCAECEGFFSKFEVNFANEVVDKLLLRNIKVKKNIDKYDNFIFSLNWRIIYDDIYILESYNKESPNQGAFYVLEHYLYRYLNAKRKEEVFIMPKTVKNYIFYIDELGFDENEIKNLNSGTFGYSFSEDSNSKYIIFTYLLGIICVTVYEPKIIIVESIFDSIKRKLNNLSIKEIITLELRKQYNQMAQQAVENEKILSSGLRDKIKKRYEK